jgi:hypothetical protein
MQARLVDVRVTPKHKFAVSYRTGPGSARMPLYMDIHYKIHGLTAEAIMAAHAKDLQVQDKYGVKYLKYWFDESTGKAFCMIDAPSKEAATAVHKEAHGLVADEIVEVKEGS